MSVTVRDVDNWSRAICSANWCAESGQARVNLPIGLGRLILGPHDFALLATINGNDLAVNMTAEVVAGDGQDSHGDRFDGSWLA